MKRMKCKKCDVIKEILKKKKNKKKIDEMGNMKNVIK